MLAVLTALVACGSRSSPPRVAPTASSVTPGGDAGFVAPPILTSAIRRPDGGVGLRGRAPANAQVRLLSPEAGAVVVPADGLGVWRLDLPPSSAPRLFAFSAELGGRTLRGEGAVATLPIPATPALLLRGGAAALAPVPAEGAVRLAAVDFDAGGGVGAAGEAAPGAEVRLGVDGEAAGAGRADARGRFSLLAVRSPLAPGAHAVRVDTSGGSAEGAVVIGAPASLGERPYAVARFAKGWRIDWAPPGGGVQSVVALDLPPSGK